MATFKEAWKSGWNANPDEVKAERALKAAQTASGSFGGTRYASGTLTINGKSFPMADCSMSIERGADVHARGFTLTTGMIGSGKLKGHMRLHVVTPEGEQVVEFKADCRWCSKTGPFRR